MKSDSPIKSKSQDILNRYESAQNVAQEILSYERKEEPIIIAFEGDWGAGKTSFLNMVFSNPCFDESSRIDFSPWEFPDTKNLVEKFYDTLEPFLRNKWFSRIKKTTAFLTTEILEIKKAEKTYSTKTINALSLAFSAFFPAAIASCTSDQTKTLAASAKDYSWIFFLILIATNLGLRWIHYYQGDFHDQKASLEKRKEGLIQILKKQKKRFYVVIDDIDRLENSTILKLFQLIKIQSNLPYISYILLYDKKVVSAAVSEEYTISGEKYLDKIVQLNYPIPCPSVFELKPIIKEEIKHIVEQGDSNRTKFLEKNDILDLITSSIKTLRGLKRFTNTLTLTFRNVAPENKPEVILIDFVLIELLRLKNPNFHQKIYQYKQELCKKEKVFGQNNPKIPNEINELLTSPTIKTDHNSTQRIFEILFPKYSHKDEDKFRAVSLRELPEEYALSSIISFDTYFSLSTTRDIPDRATLDHLLSLIQNTQKFESEYKYLCSKYFSVLERAVIFINYNDKEFITSLLSIILKMEPNYRDKKNYEELDCIRAFQKTIGSLLNLPADISLNIFNTILSGGNDILLLSAVYCSAKLDFSRRLRNTLEYKEFKYFEKDLKEKTFQQINSNKQAFLRNRYLVRNILLCWSKDSKKLANKLLAMYPNDLLTSLYLIAYDTSTKSNVEIFSYKELTSLFPKETLVNTLNSHQLKPQPEALLKRALNDTNF